LVVITFVLIFFLLHFKEDEYTIDIKRPENHKNGIMVLRGYKIVNGKEVIDFLTIYKPLFDVRDANESKIKASLLSDGTGITITEPTLPTYFFTEVKEMHDLEGDDLCVPLFRAHAVAATGIKMRDSGRLIQSTLRFPVGIKCYSEHVNSSDKNSNSLRLKSNLRVLKVDVGELNGSPIENCVHYIFWKVAIRTLCDGKVH
jgi:hypothetical protein